MVTKSSGRPNILWICTDQQRFDTLQVQGNSHINTPVLDDLWRSGTAFTHTYCQSPICTPSRASFLTGTYPSKCHNTRNGNNSFINRFPLITKLLSQAGYDCGLIGKLHLASAYGRIEPRTDDGYRYWCYSHAPRDDWEVGHDYADWVQEHGYLLEDLLKDPAETPSELHQTTWCAERTIEFIREARSTDQPWLACVNIFDPHPPFNPPQEYRDRYNPTKMPGPFFRSTDLIQQQKLSAVDFQSVGQHPDKLDLNDPVNDAQSLQAAYYAMIELIDHQVGRILNELKNSNQSEHTIVIFMSDHGEMLGDHGLIQKGCRFYEGLVRVPLILNWPGTFPEGIVSNGLVELIDLAPTLMEISGNSVPDWMQGNSLLPIATGVSNPNHHHDSVLCEYFDALDEPNSSRATMYRDQRYKIVIYHNHGLGELYDLEQDPNEFKNLWNDPTSAALKSDLVLKSYTASMNATDVGTERIGPY